MAFGAKLIIVATAVLAALASVPVVAGGAQPQQSNGVAPVQPVGCSLDCILHIAECGLDCACDFPDCECCVGE
jgi:hypothetical protein